MIVTRRKAYRINLGNYEHLETAVEVQMDTEDPAFPNLDAILFSLLQPDLDEAAMLTDYDNSFVIPFTEHNNKKGNTK